MVRVVDLNNGRFILIEVDDFRCHYRYLSHSEVRNRDFDNYGIYNWRESDIRNICSGPNVPPVVYTVIDGFKIPLNQDLE